MGDYELILNQDGDLSFRKVFRYLPGLNNTIKTLKLTKMIKLSKSVIFRIFLYMGSYISHGVGGMGVAPK